MRKYFLRPGSYIDSTTAADELNIAGLNLEKYIVSVINNPTCCPKTLGGNSLQIKDGLAITTSLQTVADHENSDTALRLSSIDVSNFGSGNNSTNTAFGSNALINNTGIEQVAIGTDALKNHNSSDYASNVAVGYGAGENLADEHNVVIGKFAGRNYGGWYSVAIGAEALVNSDLTNQVAIGYGAATTIPAGFDNVVVGTFAGQNMTSMADCIVIGNSALDNGAANSCIAIGSNSLTSNTNSQNNVAIGTNSLFSGTTGSRNVTVGYSSGRWISTGNNNTFIGNNTGPSNGIGANAAISGSIAIGEGAVPTGDNQFVVGSVGTNAGTVTNAAATQTHYWTIKINGTDYKVLLGS